MLSEAQFPFLAEKGHVVSLVGGGGKTTLLYQLSAHCARKGWRVLAATTTHKAPASREPVLLPECDTVLAVAGLSALGRPLREVCFRLDEACALLHTAPDAPLTPELLAVLLASEAGGRKLVGERAFYAVLNQADDPARRALGETTRTILWERYHVQSVLTHFAKGERAE